MSTMIVSETMFCDYERDREVRLRYLERWLVSLRAIAEVDLPPDCLFQAVLYVSDDKVFERERLEEFLSRLEPETRSRFVIVNYTHPAEGYDLPTTHPDLIKNPNKHAPRRDNLFAAALQHLAVRDEDWLIRIAIDDDDLWLPWHLREVARFAGQVRDESAIVGVGLARSLVAYISPEGVDVDEVTLSRYLSGNKFYVVPPGLHARGAKLHPWGLPEIFDEAAQARFDRVNVELVPITSNRAGWIYGRWGGNLTVDNKSPYYVNDPIRRQFPDVSNAMRQLSIG